MRVRAKRAGEQSEPHPNARAVYQHVEAYLAGALNEPALEAWRLAVGKGLAMGWALDGILRYMAELFIGDGKAGALGGTPDGRAESDATNDRRRGA